MSEVVWVVLVVLLGWASGWVGMWVALARWERRQPLVRPEPWWEPEALLTPLDTPPKSEPAPEPAKPRGKPTVCRLESERGKVSGRVTVAVRRPTLRVPTASGAALYVASHPEGAEWVYRRVGVERN